MDFMLTEEQQDLKNLVGKFMRNEIKPHLSEVDESGEFPVALYEKAFKLGLHCLEIPEEYGGSGLDHSTMGILLEEMAYTDPGFAMTMLTTQVAVECVLMGGNEAQKKRVCNIIIPGGFASFCLTEPSAGSDAAAVRTVYRIEDDTVVLNGTKCFVTNAQEASFFVIFATKDRSLGSKGITAFMVEKGTPGLRVGKHENKMGLRFSNTCELSLEEVRVPLKESMLGQEGKGMRIALGSLDKGRMNNAAVSSGISRAALDEAVAYAQVRESFGKKIIEHQAVQILLADMAIRVDASRALVRSGMALLDAGKKATKEASVAKTFCSDAAVRVSEDAVQVLGGYGYSKEYPVEKMMRDAKIFQIFEGTNQIQRMVIARELAKS